MKNQSVYDFLSKQKSLLYTQETFSCVTNGAIVIHTQRLKSDPGGNLLS
ncbi:chemotaxis protein [Escherichia coli]|nr:chemotaxis protein [Escherichia coli]